MASTAQQDPSQTVARIDRARIGGIILLGLLVVSSFALIFSAMTFDRRLSEVREADTDNQGYSVAQLEVDFQASVIAANNALTSSMEEGGRVDPAVWAALQTEFDIFYSRVGIFSAAMRHHAVPSDFISDLETLTLIRADLAAQFDSLAPDDVDGLRDFGMALRAQEPIVRGLVTDALQYFITMSQAARERERAIWQYFLIETLTLLTLILVAAVFAYRLSRALQQRTRQAERAAATITKAYEASLSAVVLTDFNGRIVLCNKAAERMFRLPMSEIIGGDASRLTPARLRPALTEAYERMRENHARNTPYRVSRQTLAERADGKIVPVELALTTDTDGDGQPIAIAFVRDISAQVQAERAMRGAVIEARNAAAAKSMFLATMSHEMRTPLHGLIAALDLIDNRVLVGEDAALFETARDCSQRALALVNDVLQFTRASATREPEVAFRPARIAEEVVGELTPFARENGNEIRFAVKGPGANLRLMGYPAAFSRSLYNLVGNAVKFSASGTITVDLVFSEPDPEGPLHLCVSVTDEGPGIAEADRERIFELFETSAEQDHPAGLGKAPSGTGLAGTGLGLPITRLAVERMGGRIQLDSELGKGSRFWFEITLPRAVATAASDEAAAPAPVAMPAGIVWDVLVVDDNEVNLTLMREMVRRLGHRVTLARNGKEAVELARETAFDVILMDISMPVMDGRTATRAIRLGGASADAAILGVTALIEAEDPDGLSDCGMDRALVKPVRPDVLAAALAEVAQTLSLSPSSAAPTADAQDQSDADAFDFAALCDMVGEDTALRLLHATLADAEAALERTKARAADAGEVAHRALGAASMVGWADMAATLREIEQSAMKGDTESMGELAEILEDLIAIARDRITKLDIHALAAS